MSFTKHLFLRRAIAFWHTHTRILCRYILTPTTAYVYHPQKQTMEADVQMFTLTKTQLMTNPPDAFNQFRSQLDLKPFSSLVLRDVLISRVYEKQAVKMKTKTKPKDLTRGTRKHYPFSLMQSLIKTIQTRADLFPQVHDLNVAYEPPVMATWQCLGETMTVRGRPGLLLNSKQPLPQFYNSSLVVDTKHTPVLTNQPNSPYIDLKQYTVKNESCTGFVGRALFPHLHTLLVLDNGEYIEPPSKGLPEIQLLQKGLLFTFGRLLAQAVLKHGIEILGKELPEPECAQCIVTDGVRFSFLWYQLNTLDTNDVTGGTNNMVYIDRPGKLYTKIVDLKYNKKGVDELNEEILRTLLSVLLMS